MPRKQQRPANTAEKHMSPGSPLKSVLAEPLDQGETGKDCATAAGQVASRQSEDRLEGDEEKFQVPRRKRDFLVPLKNGTQMDIRQVQDLMLSFRLLRKANPEHFQALFHVAQGNPEGIPHEFIQDLKDWRDLAEDGSMFKTGARDVLLSAGPTLEDPCKTGRIQDKFAVAMAEQHAEDDFWQKVKKDLLGGKGGRKGRPRD
jgi:hypothetical protein